VDGSDRRSALPWMRCGPAVGRRPAERAERRDAGGRSGVPPWDLNGRDGKCTPASRVRPKVSCVRAYRPGGMNPLRAYRRSEAIGPRADPSIVPGLLLADKSLRYQGDGPCLTSGPRLNEWLPARRVEGSVPVNPL